MFVGRFRRVGYDNKAQGKEREVVDRAIKYTEHSEVGKIAVLDLNSFWTRAAVWYSPDCESSWMLWELVMRFFFWQKGSNTPSFPSLLISDFLFPTFLLWENLTHLESRSPKLRNYRLASVNHHSTSGGFVSCESVLWCVCEWWNCLNWWGCTWKFALIFLLT